MFVANPMKQKLGSGLRTLPEALSNSGITLEEDVLPHRIDQAPQRIDENCSWSTSYAFTGTIETETNL